MSVSTAHPELIAALNAIESVVLGKSNTIRLSVACLIAGGHLLIEDVPGVGKTTLAQTMAKVFGLHFQRIQFTNDLMPADLIGHSVWQAGQFEFREGPVFTQVVLADEINRASPRTQSALLEAMAEQQVTVDGLTRPLPVPFFVIATQNPAEQMGVYPLPESQLDRFLMCVSVGYPDRGAERELLEGQDRRAMLEKLSAHLDAGRLAALQAQARQVKTTPALLDYLQALVASSRQRYAEGLSPRAALGLLAAARAWALLLGRGHVLPDDLQAVFAAVAGHRVRNGQGTLPFQSRQQACRDILEHVEVL